MGNNPAHSSSLPREICQAGLGGEHVSAADPAIVGTGVTVLIVAMVMYVVDWIADQRREKRLNGATK
jgi:hypothetical protein